MLKNIYKYIAIIIVTIIISIGFTGSHSVQSVDDLAYVIAIGIDVGDKENLKVTFQFNMPSSSGESGAGESAPSIIDSVEASSIDSAINLMNVYVSKEMNLSHCKVIVISQELAQKGIGKEIYSLMNKVQIRPDNQVIISKVTAKEYIESVSPTLENLVAKFYEVLPTSGEYTGYTINAKLGEFFNQLICNTCEPTATLGNVVKEEETEKTSEESGSSSGSGDSSSSDSSGSGEKSNESLSAKNGVENLGVAVFKDDKLVGQLTAQETLAHLLLRNELKNCNISIDDPENTNKKIDLYLISNHTARIDVNIINGTPFIKVKIIANARISSIDDISQEVTEERLSQIENSAANYLKELLYNYLYKTSKEYKSDIAGFGKYALKKFKTTGEFEEYNWLDHYQDAFFEVNTEVKLKSGFLLTGT